MRDHFKDVGDIVNIRWLEDRDTGKFRGMGVVSFENHATALKAVDPLKPPSWRGLLTMLQGLSAPEDLALPEVRAAWQEFKEAKEMVKTIQLAEAEASGQWRWGWRTAGTPPRRR